MLIVLTAKSAERIEGEGGTSSWSLSTRSMRDCEFVVCTRNTDPIKVSEFGNQSPVPHGAAFLVARVSGLEKVKVRNERQRYRVLLSEVADVLVPDFWDGSRVPTRYLAMSEVESRGINFASLNFRPLRAGPAPADAEVEPRHPNLLRRGLSIAEAKTGLSARFGVSPEDIDIVIRG